MELDKAIKNRHSTKDFKSKPADWRDILEAIDAARYAPMAGNNNTLKFVLVSSPDKIQKIADACQQSWISQTRYIVVVCTMPGRTKNLYGERAEIYTRQQAGAAIQNFLLKIEELGLATTWVGHFVEAALRRELKIPNDVEIEALFPIGYEIKKPTTKKFKKELDSLIYFDTWKEKRMKPLEKLEV